MKKGSLSVVFAVLSVLVVGGLSAQAAVSGVTSVGGKKVFVIKGFYVGMSIDDARANVAKRYPDLEVGEGDYFGRMMSNIKLESSDDNTLTTVIFNIGQLTQFGWKSDMSPEQLAKAVGAGYKIKFADAVDLGDTSRGRGLLFLSSPLPDVRVAIGQVPGWAFFLRIDSVEKPVEPPKVTYD